jgi:Mn2+/Fe2+ NRAMP family transporter
MVPGTVVAVASGTNPIELLIFAQAGTILGVPLTAVVMWLLTNDRLAVSGHRNGLALHTLVLVSIGGLAYLSVRQGLVFLGVIP